MRGNEGEFSIKDLKIDVQKKSEILINMNIRLQRYVFIQIAGTLICILIFIVDYFLIKRNTDFRNVLNSITFYILLIGFYVFMVVLQGEIKKQKEEVKITIQNFKDRMILKVCYCNNYCECKAKLNEYMKSNGIKIIKV